MLWKDRAHLCTSKICLYLGHSDLVQLPHLIDEQRKAEGTPVVEMEPNPTPSLLPTPAWNGEA